MRVSATIQSSETVELAAEGDDAASARAAIEAQVPDGFELLQIHNSMPRGGTVLAKALARSSVVETVEVEAADYVAAKASIDGQVPTGKRVLSYRML